MQRADLWLPLRNKSLNIFIMKISDLFENSNVTVAVSLNDLKEFAQEIIISTKKELEQQITEANTEAYLSPKKVCEILEVDLSTLWRWNKRGYLCHTEVGGKRRYKMSDVQTILNGGRAKQ